MTGADNINIEISGHTVVFTLYAGGSEYECDAEALEDLNISSCIATLEDHFIRSGKEPENESSHIDLWVELDKAKLFPWESNVLGISVRKDYDSKGQRRPPYVAEFSLNTAIGTQPSELREIVLSVLGGTGYKLVFLEPSGERPMFEEDGWHQWTCAITSIPNDANFRNLFMLRDTLSQAAFLPHRLITTPYLALRMIQLGQAQSLVGYRESEWLECKSVAYERKNIHESLWKHELAEDVAQFANCEVGGLLVIGYRTTRKDGIDTISKITPVPASPARLQIYRDVLRQRIHPPASRVLIDSFPWQGGEIVCIFVPPQKAENQPYLVTGSVIEGRYIKSGITIVRRQGDTSFRLLRKRYIRLSLPGAHSYVEAQPYEPDVRFIEAVTPDGRKLFCRNAGSLSPWPRGQGMSVSGIATHVVFLRFDVNWAW